MTSPSEIEGESCAWGCTIEGSHFAACPSYGVEGATDCRGCAPQPAREGVLVCDWCYRHTRGLVRNTPDLYGRLVSLTEQGKAVVYSPVKRSSSGGEVRDQITAELLDAVGAVRRHLGWLMHYVDLKTMQGFDRIMSDADLLAGVHSAVLEIHPDGEQGMPAWSIADAAARWGVERRDRHVYPSERGPRSADRTLSRFTDRESTGQVIARFPVREWFDPLLVSKDAAERADVTESQLRKWVASGELEPAARLRDPRGVTTRWFRASEVDATAKRMRERRHAGVANQPK